MKQPHVHVNVMEETPRANVITDIRASKIKMRECRFYPKVTEESPKANVIIGLVEMTRSIMFGYAGKEEEEEGKKEELPRLEPASCEEGIRKEEEKNLPPPEPESSEERMKKDRKEKSSRREMSIQLLNTFLVAILAGCVGGALVEMVVENNDNEKLLLVSILLFFTGTVLYIVMWCFLTLGTRTEVGVAWLTLISIVALVVPGVALVLGLVALKK